MVYEVVSGQTKLAMRMRFKELHANVLLPACREAGITVVQALMCEVGRLGTFVDVYAYESYGDYELRSAALEQLLIRREYYPKIQDCIVGSITIELMESFLTREQSTP